MAADNDDHMEWADSAEQIQHPKSDEDECKMFVEMLGYKRVAMKSDQETAMRALQQRVQKAVNVEMVLTNSKRYGSKSDGKVETAIQEVEGHIRTLKLHTQDRIGKTTPPHHPVINWMVKYAAEAK